MDIINMKYNTLPEQVQENKENIKMISEQVDTYSQSIEDITAEEEKLNAEVIKVSNSNNKLVTDFEILKTDVETRCDDMEDDIDELTNIVNNLNSSPYPPGALFMSNKSDSPASIWGGNWLRLKDRYIVACGDKYNFGVGGTSSFNLTKENLPNHNHIQSYPYNNSQYAMTYNTTSGSVSGLTSLCPNGTIKSNGTNIQEAKTYSSGDGEAVEYKPEYFACYTWLRIS